MANYLLLYTGGGDVPTSEEDQAAVLQSWNDWYQLLGEAVVDPGNPFTPDAKLIDSDGTIRDARGENVATGYTIIRADSREDAVRMAKGCPILRTGGRIAVYETFVMEEE